MKAHEKSKTFAIISHPDAGKTTVTEKLLLFGNAIQMAGVVKAKRSKHFVTSDWLEIEKQRGISVTSSVMQFSYGGFAINLLDTPGHADFSEDTYRVLTAVDSVLMIIDSSKGIETQTRKLFQVCRDRNLPIMTFMNKMDLEGRNPFDLVHEVEKSLNLPCCIMTWPVGQGATFKGVYDLVSKKMRLFAPGLKTRDFEQEFYEDLSDPKLEEKIGKELLQTLRDDLELLSGAGYEFNREAFLKGELSPVFFGSAAKNFGIQEFLENFLHHAPAPRARHAEERMVEPEEPDFSGVVFKIQANMDSKHRDRTAFVRICSGEFKQGMEVFHVREGRKFRIKNAIQFLSRERSHIESAFAGDIIGIPDRGSLIIGDTITQGEKLTFTGIPQFSPDLFCRVELKNPIKNKQLHKGLEQLSEEGTSQIFRRKNTSETIIGVVGQLQMEVVKFRLLNEYGADAIFVSLPYENSCWYYSTDKKALATMEDNRSAHLVYDVRGNSVILLRDDWEKDYVTKNNPAVQFFSNLITYEQAKRSKG